MKIQLLAIDMDGTTLNSQNTLSPINQKALQKAVNAGILVVPATGRQFSGLPPELEKLSGIRYYLCSNGAVVYDRQEQKILHSDLMETEQALRAYREISLCKSASSDIYIDGKAYTNSIRYAHPIDYGVDARHLDTFLASRSPLENLPDFIEHNQLRPEKIFSIFKDTEEWQSCWNTLCTWPEIAVTNSISNAIEVTNVTATKGSGLQALAKILQIPQEAVMAVGDGLNDVTMLDWAGVSVAMGNAENDVRQHAEFITDTCDNDGLAKATLRFCFS